MRVSHAEFRSVLTELGMTTTDFCNVVYQETGVCFTDAHIRAYLAKEARLSKSMSAVVRLVRTIMRGRKSNHA